MSLISKFLDFFSGNNQQEIKSTKPTNNYVSVWENERNERIKASEERLKNWLITILKEKEKLPFSWKSGNDEAFVTFQDTNDVEENNFQDLEEYMIDKLEIPDAGEFQMKGIGKIYLSGSIVGVKYSSTMKEIIDFNEETEEEIYSEVEEQDSGDIILFAV
jgi:hypothetical protein